MFGVVDEVVTVNADQGKVLDVGVALCWCVPRDQVMGFTLRDIGPAQHAALVSGDQPTNLRRGRVTVFSAFVKDFTISPEYGCGDVAVAGVPRKDGVGDDATVGELGGVLPVSYTHLTLPTKA